MGPPKPPPRTGGGKEAGGRERVDADAGREGRGPGQRAARSTFSQGEHADPDSAANSHATNSTNFAEANNVGQRATSSTDANRNRPEIIYDKSFDDQVAIESQQVAKEYMDSRIAELQQGVEHPEVTDGRAMDAINIEATRRVIAKHNRDNNGNGDYGKIPAFRDAPPPVNHYDAPNSRLAGTMEIRNLLRQVPPEHMKLLMFERGPDFRNKVINRFNELDRVNHDDSSRSDREVVADNWDQAVLDVKAEEARANENEGDVRRNPPAAGNKNRSGQVEQLQVEGDNEGKSRIKEAIKRNPKKFGALVIGLVIFILGGIGALSWYFTRGKAVAPKAKDLDKKNNRVLNPITIDIAELIETANADARIQLSEPDPKSKFVMGVGTWTSDGLKVVFTPDPAFNYSTVSVKFTLAVPETPNEFGAQSEEKTISLTFPANAQDVILTDQVRGVVNIPIPAGSSTVALPGADATSGKVTIAGKGEWSVKDLTVTFTPAPGFDYSPISTPFTLTSGTTTSQATISLSFQRPTTMVMQPPPTLSFYGNYNKPVTIHVNKATGVTGKVVFTDNSTMKVVPNEGTWLISGGDLKFTANSSFTSASVSVDYKIQFADSSFSNSAKMTIAFNKPIAIDVMKDTRFLEQGIAADANVVALASLPSPAHMDDLPNVDTVNPTSIDPKSVVILGFFMMDPESTPPAGSMEVRGKALIATGQGTWLVSEADGSIWFSPEKGFTGDPTPIFYTLSDNQGNRADAKRVVFSYKMSLDPTTISIPDDDKFWGLFKRLVINHMPPLSDMELIAQLTLQRNILSSMFQTIAKPRGLNDYIAAKDLYVAGNYTTLALYNACLKIPVEQPGTTGPHSPFWDRYYRLDLMTDLLQQHIDKRI